MNTLKKIIREELERFDLEGSIKNSNLKELVENNLGMPNEFSDDNGNSYTLIKSSFNEIRNIMFGTYSSEDSITLIKISFEVECLIKYFDNKLYSEMVFSGPFIEEIQN